jgi:hypothetical protein
MVRPQDNLLESKSVLTLDSGRDVTLPLSKCFKISKEKMEVYEFITATVPTTLISAELVILAQKEIKHDFV